MLNDVDKIAKWFDATQLAKDKLAFFMLFCDPLAGSPWGSYQLKQFHKEIIKVLEKVESWEIKKLMISVPPQHGKSSVSTIGYTAWTLGKNPYQRCVVSSYWQDLSEWFSRKIRDYVRDNNYKSLFWDIIATDGQAVSEWYTKKGWMVKAVWVGSGFTGKPADLIIIDDPHKDWEEAQSKLQRDRVWNWYSSVPLTRTHINTKTIIIMTRWHEDDLCGRLLEKEPDDWYVLNIPVFNEDGTVIRPERHPKDLVEQKRKTMGESQFQALYMGDPINEWGWAFKNDYFQYYERGDVIDQYWLWYKKELQVMTFVDPAISQKQTADSTAIVTVWLDKKNNDVYVLDIRHWKMLPDEIISNVFNVVDTYKPLKVGIETNQFQKMLEIELRKKMREKWNFFNLEWQTSSMNKEAKVVSVLQPRYSNGTMLHMKRGANVWELEVQLMKFPNGKHDDIVDSLSMAVMMLTSVTMWGKKQKVVKTNWL